MVLSALCCLGLHAMMSIDIQASVRICLFHLGLHAMIPVNILSGVRECLCCLSFYDLLQVICETGCVSVSVRTVDRKIQTMKEYPYSSNYLPNLDPRDRYDYALGQRELARKEWDLCPFAPVKLLGSRSIERVNWYWHGARRRKGLQEVSQGNNKQA